MVAFLQSQSSPRFEVAAQAASHRLPKPRAPRASLRVRRRKTLGASCRAEWSDSYRQSPDSRAVYARRVPIPAMERRSNLLSHVEANGSCSLLHARCSAGRRVADTSFPAGPEYRRPGAILGNWSYVRPSSCRPFTDLRTPPHCLKKNGTAAARHWSRNETTHFCCIGRAPGPLSPPTITQWMPWSSMNPRSSRSGSTERKRTAAGACLSVSTRVKPFRRYSTLTPHQMWSH